MVVFNQNAHPHSHTDDARGAGRTREGWTRIMERAWALKVARDALVQEVMQPHITNEPTGAGAGSGTGALGSSLSAEGRNAKVPVYRPRMDMYDDPESTHISAALELPGLKRDSIRVVVQDQFLLVSGERRPFPRPTPQHHHQRVNSPKAEPADADGMVIDSEPTPTPPHSATHPPPRSVASPPMSAAVVSPSTGRRPATPYDPIADARAQARSDSMSSYRSSYSDSHPQAQPQSQSQAHQSRFVTSAERERSTSPLTGSYSQSQSQMQAQHPETPTASSASASFSHTSPVSPSRSSSGSQDTIMQSTGVTAQQQQQQHMHAHAHAQALPILTPTRKEAQHLVREFKFGRFQRVIALGPGVSASDVSATLDDGILTITWPRPPAHLANTPETHVRVESQRPPSAHAHSASTQGSAPARNAFPYYPPSHADSGSSAGAGSGSGVSAGADRHGPSSSNPSGSNN